MLSSSTSVRFNFAIYSSSTAEDLLAAMAPVRVNGGKNSTNFIFFCGLLSIIAWKGIADSNVSSKQPTRCSIDDVVEARKGALERWRVKSKTDGQTVAHKHVGFVLSPADAYKY